jgi:UDP-glucose:(heptosyl)LPS alpha-1,3-glucosyltransferase
MNLAFCLFNYFPFGGLERNFMAISQECSRRGHTIDVYTIHWEGEAPQEQNINIVSVRGFSNHSKAASFSKYLHNNLDRSRYDLVLGFNKIPGIDLYYTADVCYSARIDKQRNFLSKLTPRYRVFSELEHSIFATSSPTHIIYLSEQEKKIYQDIYGTQEKRFHYAPPGIDKNKIRSCVTEQNRKEIRNFLKIREKDNFLLMIGSNFQTKGVDRSIKALASLSPTLLKSTYLFIIGKGKEKKYTKLAISQGIGGNVHFLGGRDDVPLFLAGADFLLQPSLNENTGNAIIEALVAGVPVLATENCGYSNHIALAKAGKIIPSFPFTQEKMNTLLLEMIESFDRELWKKNALTYTDKTDLYSRHTMIADLIETLGSAKK